VETNAAKISLTCGIPAKITIIATNILSEAGKNYTINRFCFETYLKGNY
jgi:hypothetical protein